MDQKTPADRAHLWEHAARPAAPAAPVYDYEHQLPRHLHHPEHGSKIVSTPDECDAAFAEGYLLHPAPVATEPAADAAPEPAKAPKSKKK